MTLLLPRPRVPVQPARSGSFRPRVRTAVVNRNHDGQRSNTLGVDTNCSRRAYSSP
jgi:hypothetical protein